MKKKKNPRFLNEQKKGKPDANRGRRRSSFAVIALLLVLAVAGGVWWFMDYTKDDGLIYPNVLVYGVDLGGQTPEDAVPHMISSRKLPTKPDALRCISVVTWV